MEHLHLHALAMLQVDARAETLNRHRAADRSHWQRSSLLGAQYLVELYHLMMTYLVTELKTKANRVLNVLKT